MFPYFRDIRPFIATYPRCIFLNWQSRGIPEWLCPVYSKI